MVSVDPTHAASQGTYFLGWPYSNSDGTDKSGAIGGQDDNAVDPLISSQSPEAPSMKKTARDTCRTVAFYVKGVYSGASWVLSCLDPFFLATKVYRAGILTLKEMALLTFAPERKLEGLRDRLHQFSLSEHRGNVCTVAAHLVRDWLIHSFHHPPYPNPHEPSNWATRLFRSALNPHSFLGQRVEELLKEEEDLLLHSVEATFLRAFSGISSCLAAHTRAEMKSPKFDKDFLLNTGSKLLETIIQHCHRINDLHSRYGKHLDPDLLKAEFGKELHRAIPCDPRMTLAEQKKYQEEHFFKKFAERILNLAFPRGQADLEAPFYIRGPLWSALKKVIIPDILAEVYHHALSPHALNEFILTTLETPNPRCLSLLKEATASSNLPEKKQRRLNTLAEQLIREVSTFLSPSLAKSLSKIPGISKKLGTLLGRSLGGIFYQPNVVDIMINSSIEKVLPRKIHGRWKIIRNHLRFTPLKGKTFHFTFPKNPSAKRELQEAQEERQEKIKARLLQQIDHINNHVGGEGEVRTCLL